VVVWRCYPDILLEGLRKTKDYLPHDSQRRPRLELNTSRMRSSSVTAMPNHSICCLENSPACRNCTDGHNVRQIGSVFRRNVTAFPLRFNCICSLWKLEILYGVFIQKATALLFVMQRSIFNKVVNSSLVLTLTYTWKELYISLLENCYRKIRTRRRSDRSLHYERESPVFAICHTVYLNFNVLWAFRHVSRARSHSVTLTDPPVSDCYLK
jgi:hypothetical protein